uniref:Dentin sialophosphoprotein-like n=1 Tax=Diabrotica virgifera virgifera TaxID=50390 RepID=A0A6P7GXR1_DIAVI
MFEFREQSIRNDNKLKEKYAEITKNRQTNGEVDVLKKDAIGENSCGVVRKKGSDIKAKLKERSKHIVHPSITPIFKKYPSIRLPSVCIKSNISPTVVMGMDEVENYFKKRNLDMQKYINMALTNQKRRVAMKSTSKATISNFIKKKTIPEYFSALKNSNIDRSESPEVSRGVSNLRKRKRSISSGSSSSQNVMKPLQIDTSEDLSSSSPSPVPSVISDVGSDLSFTQSKEMHMCNICNSVFALAVSLKKHQLKHLRCQFCKFKFTSIKAKDTHLKYNCKVQKIMKSMAHLPDIPLQKIEQNVKIRQKFQNTFAAFNLLPKENSTTAKRQTKISNIKKPDTDKTATKKLKDIEIKIRNSQIYAMGHPEATDNDTKMIKAMLQQYNKLNRKINSVAQTHLPTNSFIKFHHSDVSVELKHLKQNLYYHKIPVEIHYGSSFNASYKYDASFKNTNEISKNKKLQKWDDLDCCDITFGSRLNESGKIKLEILATNNEETNEKSDTEQETTNDLNTNSTDSESTVEYYKDVMDECNDKLNNADKLSLNLEHSQSEKEHDADKEENLTKQNNKNAGENENGESKKNSVDVVESLSNNYDNIKSIDTEDNDNDFSGFDLNTEKEKKNSGSNNSDQIITNDINITNDNKNVEEKDNGECHISEEECINHNNVNDNNYSSSTDQNIERDSENNEHLESEVNFPEGNKSPEISNSTNVSDISTIRVKTVCELNN